MARQLRSDGARVDGARSETEGLSRSYVRPCLLLLLAEGPSHGYELLEQVRHVGVRNADAGGLYRSLRAMEQADLVSSWWEPSQAGPARRSYLLTDDGRQALAESLDTMREVHGMLGEVLDRYDLLAASGAPAAVPAAPAPPASMVTG